MLTKTTENIEAYIRVITAAEGKPLSTCGVQKLVNINATKIKRELDVYCQLSNTTRVLDKFLVGTYSYYRVRKISRETELFRGWGGAVKLGLK